MQHKPISTSRQPGRRLLVAALLALGYSAAHAQVTPKPAPTTQSVAQNTAYYLDGKKISQADLASIRPDNILSVDVVKDNAQKRSLGESKADGVALITTKANANSPKVVAFNKRFPMTPATPAEQAGIAAATAYVAQHYPAAKLEAVLLVQGKTDRYNATFTDKGKRVYLLFDGQGNVVEQ